ncbi:MAG: hypothetical protein WAR78_14105 [Ferruginibacter sp.]
MIKKLFCIILCCNLSTVAMAQAVLFINAGSRAGYGNNQELTFDINGGCRYYLRELNGPVKDSALFSIGRDQLQAFFNRAEQSGFFGLDKKYSGGAVDGAGIYISMNSAGKKHQVSLVNTDQPVINELVTLMNTMLAPHKIIINYGQFVTK